ncbi:MAG TPA: hypothetical protein VF771_03715 [Longimicrobiaceae bacterium]
MRKWMIGVAAAIALIAACGREPTAARAPQRPRHDVDPLTASIQGPSTIQTYVTCTWAAIPSGGTPPYHYYWSAWGFQQGTDSTFSASITNGGIHTLYLAVVDQDGTEATSSRVIAYTTTPIGCPNS